MKKADNLVKVLTGSETLVTLLKGRLEEFGITTLIKDDSITAYLGTPPPSVDLYIQEIDLNKADSIITEFFNTNHG